MSNHRKSWHIPPQQRDCGEPHCGADKASDWAHERVSISGQEHIPISGDETEPRALSEVSNNKTKK